MILAGVAFFLFFPFALLSTTSLEVQIPIVLCALVVLFSYPGGYSPSISRIGSLRQPHRLVLLAVPLALTVLTICPPSQLNVPVAALLLVLPAAVA